jgi:molybdate-binding protein
MSEADGLIQRAPSANRRADIGLFVGDEPAEKCLVLAGCDPAMGLVGHAVEKVSGIDVVCAPASSTLALKWLKEGKVHFAGMHLQEAKSGEYNLPFIRRQFPDEEITVVTFARWEEGLVVARGNPKRIRTLEHLGRKNVRFVNREPGSGSRALLERLLKKIGLEHDAVTGYGRVAFGHLAAARCVLSGEADVCLATSSAARNYRLDFIPLHCERYDLVMRKQVAGLPAAKALLDILQRAALRRKLEVLAGYDTSETGMVSHLNHPGRS